MPVPVGAERHAGNDVGVPGQRLTEGFGRCPRPTAAPSCRQLAVASRCPSGLNTALAHEAGVSGERLVGIPKADGGVAAGGDEPAPVGTERDGCTTASVCPLSGSPRGRPVSAFHTRTVLSAAAGGQAVPIGAETPQLNTDVGAGLAGVGVPQPDSTVAAGAGQPVPVGAERHAGHHVAVSGQRLSDRLAGVDVPQPHGLVRTAGGEGVTVGAERHRQHGVGVPGQRRTDRLPGVGVPQPHGPVLAAADQPMPVGADRYAGQLRPGIDDLDGVGAGVECVQQCRVIRFGGQRACSEHLLERACVAAGIAAGQHVIAFGAQKLRYRAVTLTDGFLALHDRDHRRGDGGHGQHDQRR